MNIEVPAQTEAKQILEKLDKQTEAINAMGANIQWIVENVQGIFQMFGSPQMMAMLPQMMNGAIGVCADFPGCASATAINP